MMLARVSRLRRRLGRSALAVIACLLICSALVRLGVGAGQAVARATEAGETPQDAPVVQPVAVSGLGADDIGQSLTNAQITDLVSAFQAREARLAEREAALEDRMAALRVADQQISQKLAQLEEAERQLRETIAIAETASKDDLDRLTRVYESMKPKQAAALFEDMDPSFAAGFLGRMRPEAAAEIMAGLSPEAAHTFSVVLAGRNANVPTE